MERRFYILHIENRPFEFSKITHHARVTQCLGSVDREAWYLGVAKASIVEGEEVNGGGGGRKLRSESGGHLYVAPNVDEIRAFKISGAKFVKLNKGTWHAGPLFRENARDFYNLELTNTNVSASSFFFVLGSSFLPFCFSLVPNSVPFVWFFLLFP